MSLPRTILLTAMLAVSSLASAQHTRALATTSSITVAASSVPVATRDLARGTVLAASDIAWTVDSNATRTARAQSHTHTVAIGWIARRMIRAGELLIEPSVSQPDLVTNGDHVDVLYRNDGVNIRLRGTAIGNGVQGDVIYVKLDNRRRVRGIVDAPNTVRVQ